MEKTNDIKIIYISVCCGCGRPIEDEWQYCPYCKKKVDFHVCNICSKLIKTNWKYCPFCKTEVLKGKRQGLIFEEGNKWLKDLLEL